MIPLVALALTPRIPAETALRPTFEEFGLPVYAQPGPWCWAYTTNSVVEYEFAKASGKGTPLSTGFLAWAAEACDAQGSGGSNFGRASRGLAAYGVAPLTLGGEPPAESPVPKPSAQALDSARRGFGVELKWLRFWSRERVSDAQLAAIRGELAAGHPVAVGMQWPKRTEFDPGTWTLTYPSPSGFVDGHCVVLCGYRDDPRAAEGGTFLFRNSWGDRWAERGYATMTVGMLRESLNDAFAVRVEKRPKPETIVRRVAAEEMFVEEPGASRASLQEMEAFGDAWGGRPQLLFLPSAEAKVLRVTIAAPKAGRCAVLGRLTTAEDYGTYSLAVNGQKAAARWNGAAAGVSLAPPFRFGTFDLRAGKNELAFRLEGRSSASRGDALGIHEIDLAQPPGTGTDERHEGVAAAKVTR